MVIVKNIKIAELNLIKDFKDKKTSDIKKCIELLEYSDSEDNEDDDDISVYIKQTETKGKDTGKTPHVKTRINETKAMQKDSQKEKFQKLLPKKSKFTVSFELTKTNVDIANGIRRCIIDEMEVLSFDFDENKNIDTDDVYILSDYIKQQVDMLPINQEFNYENTEITLKCKNNTVEIIDVLSANIEITQNGKPVDMANIVGPTIVLCRLRPDRYININKMFISRGTALINAGKYSLVSNTQYRILDVNPIIETPMGKTGDSSMKSNPTHFYISYSTHRNIDHPLNIMVKCCDNLIARLNKINTDMKNIADSDISYFSNLITLNTDGNLKKIHITGEYWTIINMISRYCYILTNENIKLISPALIHPEREVGIINIIHPEFSTLIQNSIKKIIDELKTIKMAFQQK